MQPGVVTTAKVQREMVRDLAGDAARRRWHDPRATLREANRPARSSGVHVLDDYLAARSGQPRASASTRSGSSVDSDPALEALGRSWKEVQAAAQEYRDAAEAEVVRWAWGPRFAGWARLEPLFVLRAHGRRASIRRVARARGPHDERAVRLR